MSMRAKLISSVVLAAILLATWRFVSPPTGVPRVESRKPAPYPGADPVPRFETPEPAAVLAPFPPTQESHAPTQSSFAESQSVVDPSALNERTLVGTKWERDGFRLEFGADGKLVIGGGASGRGGAGGCSRAPLRGTTGDGRTSDGERQQIRWGGETNGLG